jgi:ABC-type nitrate/sulfonate/bicarbonate transport system substrate-binding protein
MRKTAVLVWALVLAALFSVGSAQQRLVQVKLQLKWFPQAQFAGYFVAKEQGFFRDEGLEVTLLPIGAQSPMQPVVSGGADFGTTWITDLLTAREQGLPADAKAHQTWQMAEIAKLYNAGPKTKGWTGFLDPAAYTASTRSSAIRAS